MRDDVTPDERECCSLSEQARTLRSAELAVGLMGRVREVRELPEGYALRFDSTPEARGELEEFVEFERRCCAFLGFEIRTQGDELWLSVTGSPSARKQIRGLLRRTGVELPIETAPGPARKGLLGAVSSGIAGMGAIACCATLALPWALGALGLGAWTGAAGELLELAGACLVVGSAVVIVRRLRARRKLANGWTAT